LSYGYPQNTQGYYGPSDDERMLAMICHLGGLFAAIFLALIIWIIKKDSSSYIDYHAKQALNFQISMMIYMMISVVLIFVFIGILLIIPLVVMNIVFSIMAAVKANNGEYYQYPLTIQFLS
jgi:uncharacterized protein